ncbi:MAG TPA: aromatic-ring-hydroxylating dioxygenase subunit beta [Chloroflexota bacterium]|nr:aromatic-ring-hydroxylating dioxygenase subunit beta [Chloroflexota bacterium]
MALTVDRVLQQEVERFLYEEAWLLDEQRFHEWLDLFTDDIRYLMPTSESLHGKPSLSQEDDLVLGYFDEDKHALGMRVRQLDTGLRHVELPPSVTRRLITNILVDPAGSPNELLVRSNFLISQVRHGRHESQFTGKREDRLRQVGGEWKVARRVIVLSQAMLPRTLSIFF